MEARSRPGYVRKDTDGIALEEVSPSSSNATPELQDNSKVVEAKTDEVRDNTVTELSDEDLPAYDAANDGAAHIKEPVETAKDLVTQVIHVDDNPDLNPYTFRMFFLGTQSPALMHLTPLT